MSLIVPLRFGITRIVDYAKGWSKLTDGDLLEKAKAIRWEMKSGVSSRALQDECLSLAIDACRRSMEIFHFPVQILGALNLLNGRVIEMQTGEVKTATAVLPAAVRAMVGRGCHVVTSNDYLAKRDAEILRPAYQLLGLTVLLTTTAQRAARLDVDVGWAFLPVEMESDRNVQPTLLLLAFLLP